VWDFAGQEIYYTTHQFFLSGIVFVHDSVFLFQFQWIRNDSVFSPHKARALYLIVWNMQEDEELSKIEFWLQSVKSRVSSAPIILVGTHLDLVSKVCFSYWKSFQNFVKRERERINTKTEQPCYYHTNYILLQSPLNFVFFLGYECQSVFGSFTIKIQKTIPQYQICYCSLHLDWKRN
jgi:GTPase SAR1 family protein